MSGNTLSRSIGSSPPWITQTVIGLILTSLVAWASWSTATVNKQDARISVVEARAGGVDSDITEIKQTLIRLDSKLDRLVERNNGK